MARFPIRHFPEAVDELEEAVSWYDAQSPAAAEKFRLAVRRTLASIAATPKLWAADRQGIREVLIRPFSFSVVYQIGKGAIQIIAFAHTSRRQGYWRERLKNR